MALTRIGGSPRVVQSLQGSGTIQNERLTVNVSGGTVVFPRSFAAIPVVNASPMLAAGDVFVAMTAVTATSFNWSAYNDAGTLTVITDLHYMAIGALP